MEPWTELAPMTLVILRAMDPLPSIGNVPYLLPNGFQPHLLMCYANDICGCVMHQNLWNVLYAGPNSTNVLCTKSKFTNVSSVIFVFTNVSCTRSKFTNVSCTRSRFTNMSYIIFIFTNVSCTRSRFTNMSYII